MMASIPCSCLFAALPGQWRPCSDSPRLSSSGPREPSGLCCVGFRCWPAVHTAVRAVAMMEPRFYLEGEGGGPVLKAQTDCWDSSFNLGHCLVVLTIHWRQGRLLATGLGFSSNPHRGNEADKQGIPVAIHYCQCFRPFAVETPTPGHFQQREAVVIRLDGGRGKFQRTPLCVQE